MDAELNEILLAYQKYYRDAFYLCIAKEQAENKLKERLAKLLNIADEHIALCELEQKNLVDLFESRGLHFLGGKTGGYYGPYIWRTTETVTYDVENKGEDAIKKLGESWGSDKTTYSEGAFPGAEDVTGYWATLPPSEDGSGFYETAVGRDYMDGALIFELTGHNGEDDAQNMEVSDQMASVIDSLTFEQ